MQKLFSNITCWFINRYRITLIITLAILTMGALSYGVFLPREGFPAISFPVGFVTAVYLGEAEDVDKDISTPIDNAIGKLSSLNSSNSITQDNFARFILQFKQGSDPKEEIDKLKAQVSALGLPENAQLDFQVIKAASTDGVNDMLVNVSKAGASVSELEEAAAVVAKSLDRDGSIESALVKTQITQQINPITGQEVSLQREFSRVALRNENGNIAFAPAVSIGIIKKDGISSVELSSSVAEVIARLKEEEKLPGFTLSTTGDLAEIVEEQILSLESNAVAGFLVIVAILFLLVSWRSSLVTALFMPLVMGGTFIALYLTGNSLNTISLFALILVLGLFVDDAIVVVDSIEAERRSGKNALESIKAAISKIAIADISGTLTTLLVFLPMLAISGILGDFIKLIPITVIMALIISLSIALTLIPLLFRITIWGKPKVTKFGQFISLPGNLINSLGHLVSNFVAIYLRSKILTGLVIIVSLGLIFFGASKAAELDFNIFPAAKDGNEIVVNVSYDGKEDIATAQSLLNQVETSITEVMGSDLVKTEIIDATVSAAEAQITLVSYNERKTTSPEYIERLEKKLALIEGIDYKVSLAAVGPPTQDYNYFIQIFAEERSELEELAERVSSFISASEFGLGEDMLSPSKVETLNLDVIARKNGRLYAQIGIAFASGYQETTGINIAKKTQAEFSALVDDSQIEFDQGIASDNLSAFTSTIFAFAVSIVAIYVLLVLQFNSFSQPLLVLTALPFSFVGLFPGLLATDNALSFFVMIGLIALSGIVVNNTIMLIDFANQELSEGKSVKVAIVDALKLRFRALLTTSVTSVLGLLPLALSDPFWESLGFTIVFGLISSTTLVILVFPAYFAVIEKLRRWKNGLFARS